jgi:hypothetical protein
MQNLNTKKCACGCGTIISEKNTWAVGHHLIGKPNYYKDKKRPDHSRKLLKNNDGKGGYSYYHGLARKIHYTGYCEHCGIKPSDPNYKYKIDLDMHCVSKDYTNMSKNNWVTVCKHCHKAHYHSGPNWYRDRMSKDIQNSIAEIMEA